MLQDDSALPKFSQEEEINSPDITERNKTDDTDAEDADPALDDEDLEENGLTVEEADAVVWDPPTQGSSGPEEKDLTD